MLHAQRPPEHRARAAAGPRGRAPRRPADGRRRRAHHRLELGQQRGDHRDGARWRATRGVRTIAITSLAHATSSAARASGRPAAPRARGRRDRQRRRASATRRSRSRACRRGSAPTSTVVGAAIVERARRGGRGAARRAGASCRRSSRAATSPAATRPNARALGARRWRRLSRDRRRRRSPSAASSRASTAALDPRAAARPHRLPRRAGHEHASCTRPRTTRCCGATGGCRTTARRWRACAELVERVRGRTGWSFAWCISPGLSIRYSDDADLDALVGQAARASRRSASTRFGLLLDDIPGELQHPQDRAAFDDLAEAHVALVEPGPRGLPAGMPPRRLPDGLLGHGHRALPRRAGRRHRPPHRPVLDRPRHLLADARPRRCRDVHAHDEPAADVLGQLPGQRRGHGLRAAHRAVPRSRPAAVARLDRHRRQRHGAVRGVAHPVRDHRRLPARPRGLRPRGELAAGACAMSSARRTSRRSRCSRTTCARRACPRTTRRSSARRSSRAAFRLDQGDAAARAAADLRALADRLLARGRPPAARPGREPARSSTRRGPGSRRSSSARRPSAASPTWPPRATRAATGRAELRPFLIRLRRARVRVFGDVLEMTLSVLSGTMFRPGEVP